MNQLPSVPGVPGARILPARGPDEQRDVLERRANVVRSRLVRVIDALDARRHQVAEIGQQAKRLAVPVVGAVVGLAVLAAGVTLLAFQALRARRRRRLGPAIQNAIASLRPEREQPLLQRVASRVTLSLGTFLATEIAKRIGKNVLDGRLPDGRLVAGRWLEGRRASSANAAAEGRLLTR